MSGLLIALWAFIKSPLGRALSALVAVIVLLAIVHQHGVDAGVAEEKAAESLRLRSATQAVAKVEAAGAKISAEASADLIKTQTEIRWRTRVQLQEVIRYVPIESDRACVVGVGALRLHDHALAGLPGLPAAAGGSVETDSRVPLSALVADDVEFAGVAYDWKAEALTWRGWYARHSALWADKVKPPPDH